MSALLSFSPHRAISLESRIWKSLCFHMRRRNRDGVKSILKETRLQIDAGGEEELAAIIRHLCVGAASVKGVHMHPKDRERWAQWAMSLWV